MGLFEESSNLHGAIVHFDSIQLRCSLNGATRFVEDDSGNAAALSVWSVGKKNFLDWAYSFGKIVLSKTEVPCQFYTQFFQTDSATR